MLPSLAVPIGKGGGFTIGAGGGFGIGISGGFYRNTHYDTHPLILIPIRDTSSNTRSAGIWLGNFYAAALRSCVV